VLGIGSKVRASQAAAPNHDQYRGPTFDATHSYEFLSQVFAEIHQGSIGISRTHPKGLRSEHHRWVVDAVKRAAEWNRSKPEGIYFRVTALPPRGPSKGRGSEADTVAVPGLWADLDFGMLGHADPGHEALPLPPTPAAALLLVSGLPMPSLLINSGGGLYPLWLFERPVMVTDANRAAVKSLSQHWQAGIVRRAEQLGWAYTPVGDLARLLRLPGSINRKADTERLCRVVQQSGVRYPIEELAQIAERNAPGNAAPDRKADQVAHRRSAPRGLAGLLRTVSDAQQGNRNNALHWSARRAVEQGLSGSLAVRDAFEQAALGTGLTASEVAATLKSAGFRHE
jgi:hypothetical protein